MIPFLAGETGGTECFRIQLIHFVDLLIVLTVDVEVLPRHNKACEVHMLHKPS